MREDDSLRHERVDHAERELYKAEGNGALARIADANQSEGGDVALYWRPGQTGGIRGVKITVSHCVQARVSVYSCVRVVHTVVFSFEAS